MSEMLPCSMCGNKLSPQATFCPQCGHPHVATQPKAAKPNGVADMSGVSLRELMAVIEQNLEILRSTAIHGTEEMKALAVALLRARGQKSSAPPKGDQLFDTPMQRMPPEEELPGGN